MKAARGNRLLAVVRAQVFSPRWFLSRAALITIFYVICHAAGLRAHVAFLSGTSGSGSMSINLSAILGLTYIVGHFGFVLVVPIFLIAAVLLMGRQRFLLWWRGGA